MSFINWGEESPEQLAARKRIEEAMMFEQVAYSAAMAAAAAAAGSGGIKSNKYIVNDYVEDGYFE
jgi:hypothetical protein